MIFIIPTFTFVIFNISQQLGIVSVVSIYAFAMHVVMLMFTAQWSAGKDFCDKLYHAVSLFDEKPNNAFWAITNQNYS